MDVPDNPMVNSCMQQVLSKWMILMTPWSASNQQFNATGFIKMDVTDNPQSTAVCNRCYQNGCY